MMPNTNDHVQLVNARIVDVENGCYYPPQVSLVIQNGEIVAMPGLPGEPDHPAVDAVIDLGGRPSSPACSIRTVISSSCSRTSWGRSKLPRTCVTALTAA
jgi:hypothetical protein